MARAGLVAAVLLLALTAHAAMQPATPAAQDDEAVVSRALDYLATQRVTPETVEAFVAAGRDPTPLLAAVHVPAPDPDDPNGPLRELHALLRAGIRTHDDPQRGAVDLVDDLRRAHEGAAGSGAAGTLGFWLLSAHALGWNATDADVRSALDELAGTQRPDGAFPCLGHYASLDCTAFAVTALAAHGGLDRIDRDAARADILAHCDGGACTDGFTGHNAQSTAWAATALRHLGDDAAADEGLAWLRDLQRPDGSFARAPGQPGPMAWWTTAEAVVALSGGHPVPALAPRPTGDGVGPGGP